MGDKMRVITCMEVLMDETSQKIIDAMMGLIREKGYVATTTKDIAKKAGVNECTLFRKFKNKKDIVLQGVEQERWRGHVTVEAFQNVVWDLKPDLEMFMKEYMNRMSKDFVNLSIGLRAPQIYEETAPLIMKVPQAFLSALTAYFTKMEQKGKLSPLDFECLAMSFFSSTFGYTFLRASFDNELFSINQEEYVKKTVDVFCHGILQMTEN